MHSPFPISSHGVLQFFKKCCTRDAPIVFRNAYNPTPPSAFGPPLIGNAVVLLYPHFAIIFGADTWLVLVVVVRFVRELRFMNVCQIPCISVLPLRLLQQGCLLLQRL